MQIPVGPREEGLSALPLEMQAVVHCAFTWSHGGPERAAHAPQFPKKSSGRAKVSSSAGLFAALGAFGPPPARFPTEL